MFPSQEGTSEMQRNSTRPRLRVTGDAKNVVAHAGSRLLCDLADELGLTEELSVAMAPTKRRRRGHDRGRVLVDLAVMLAGGGETISDLATLRDQPQLFGEVASLATAWRALEAIDDTARERIASARAAARSQAWAAGMDPGFYVIDIDATLVTAHSQKEGAAPTYKRGFGFHPLIAFLDATGEALAAKLRPGNAGSGTASDHVEVLDDALGQLPVDPGDVEVIARADSAGLSHGFVDACRDRQVRFVIGHRLTAEIAKVLVNVAESAWRPAINADGCDQRDGAEVVEITEFVDLSTWGEGIRMIARREDPHPGAQLTFTDVDGHRFQVLVTDLADPDTAYLEALYRGRGRAERQICDAKDTGLANLPSASFAINTAWLQLVLVAHDLLAWTRHLCLDDDLAIAEPKRLRYCLLHTAALITRSARRTTLQLAANWPWRDQLVTAFKQLHALPIRA
ncbi:MAG: IS1380 family transposase [Acidimicrobiia bacterium]